MADPAANLQQLVDRTYAAHPSVTADAHIQNMLRLRWIMTPEEFITHLKALYNLGYSEGGLQTARKLRDRFLGDK